MDGIFELMFSGFECGQKAIEESNKRFAAVDANLQSYVFKAAETHMQKNPKTKRFMKTMRDASEDEREDSVPPSSKGSDVAKESSTEKELRPIRTAKSHAAKNLREPPLGTKMRNDNNVAVSIKSERSSSNISSARSSESVKENKTPNENQRKSPDEGIQSASESDAGSTRGHSVELITTKIDEIDITGADGEMMPPPQVPQKVTKKARTKQKKHQPMVEEEVPLGALRVTRSKIKQEKISIDVAMASPAKASGDIPVLALSVAAANESVIPSETTISKKGSKKKYPLPIQVKIEEPEKITEPSTSDLPSAAANQCNETFNVATPQLNNTPPVLNETVTIAPVNTTVTLSKNIHDSLMTEDNDEDEPMEDAPPPLLPKKQAPIRQPSLRLKKNEVFNPYHSSPVKQRIQAFEKHASHGMTPAKYNTLPSKLGSLKSGTPSKIATFSKVTTPMSTSKNIKLTSSSVPTMNMISQPGGYKGGRAMKNTNSMSQESLSQDEAKKVQDRIAANNIEEKKKNREEKMKQAQQQREALEKENREKTVKQQQERDEKYRKIMKEKEEKQRMEMLKKKMNKEKQAKKYAEEKARNEARKDDFLAPAPKPMEPPALKQNDSLQMKLQKQILLDKSFQKKKAESKNTYSFDMLHTDDSTDDESKPSQSRPAMPDWSKKRQRKPTIVLQSHINPNVLDSLFSVQPISVDLREIFPAIDVRKLVRNSSAIWRTPPKNC